jgi:2-phospho-L-lactate guanylyltransferase
MYDLPTTNEQTLTMRVLVPYRVEEPKTRLAPMLDLRERRELSRLMLVDVLTAIREAGYEPTVLSTAPLSIREEVVVDDRPLTAAVNGHLESDSDRDTNTAIVMADLALVTSEVLSRLLEADGDVVLAPGRGGGTNALVTRHPQFRVDYHGASYRDHRAVCDEIGASTRVIDSHRLSTDIDETDDLGELLLHGDGRAADWLDTRFELSVSNGRVGVERQ